MFLALFMLAASFGTNYATAVRVASVATDLSQERDPALYFPTLAKEDEDAARHKMAALWVTFAFYESSFRHDALGDHGSSCGAMQVKPKAGYPSCTEMRKSMRVGMRAGAQAMEDAIKECGSLQRGLMGYVSGNCNVGRDVVRTRCAHVGGCP